MRVPGWATLTVLVFIALTAACGAKASTATTSPSIPAASSRASTTIFTPSTGAETSTTAPSPPPTAAPEPAATLPFSVPDDPGAAPAAPADGGGGGPATPTDATDPATTAAPDPTADSAAPPPSTEVATAPTAVPSSSSGTAPPIYENTAEVGGLARSLLQPQPRASVVLEIDVVAGSRVPAAANVANLVDVLKRETGKPVAVDQRSVTATVPAQQVWTITDVARAEYQARAHRPIDGGSVSVMVLYLPGRYVSDTVLGFAFRGGSVAIFPDRLDASGNALVTPQQIEKSNLVHEAGHLLGLVNIDSRVYTSPRPHEDTTHRGHSKNTRSVMFWAIESTSVTTILSGGPPDSFDGDDEADLADIRSGSS